MSKQRWHVACINWSHRDAPKAVAYLFHAERGIVFDKYFPTHAEAVAYADKHARAL